MSDPLALVAYMVSVARILIDPQAPAKIRQAQDAITDTLRQHREHMAQLDSWENEGGANAQSR